MSEIIEEISQDLRREKWQAHAKKYGPYVGIAVVIIALIGGGIYYSIQQERTAREQAVEQLSLALGADEGQKIEALRVLSQQEGSVADVANLYLAMEKKADLASSIASLEQIISRQTLPIVYIELAQLWLEYLQFKQNPNHSIGTLQKLTTTGQWQQIARIIILDVFLARNETEQAMNIIEIIINQGANTPAWVDELRESLS